MTIKWYQSLGLGVSGLSEPRFRRFLEKHIRFKNVPTWYCVGLMQMSLFCLLFRMDQAQEILEGTTKNVNPSISDPSRSNRSDHVSTEALVKISQDMARVLDRLTALRAPIDSIRKHGVEEFHGISLEEYDKANFLA